MQMVNKYFIAGWLGGSGRRTNCLQNGLKINACSMQMSTKATTAWAVLGRSYEYVIRLITKTKKQTKEHTHAQTHAHAQQK